MIGQVAASEKDSEITGWLAPLNLSRLRIPCSSLRAEISLIDQLPPETGKSNGLPLIWGLPGRRNAVV